MKNFKTFPARSAVALAIVLAFPAGSVFADEVKDLTSPNVAEASFSVLYLDKLNPQYRLFSGLDNAGTLGTLGVNIVRRDDNGMWVKIQARNVGLRNQEFGASVEQQGDWRVGVDYSQNAKVAPYTLNTKVAGVGTANQALNTDFRSWQGLGPESTLKLERVGSGLYGSKYIADAFKFNFSLKTEEKTGAIMSASNGGTWSSPAGAPFAGKNYSALYFSPQPETYRHNQFEASLDYFTRKLQLSLGVYMSALDNANIAMNTTPGQNSLSSTAGPVTSPWISLPPSNRATQWDLSGAYNVSDATRFSFKVAKETATQDTPFIASYGSTAVPAEYTKINPPGVPYASGITNNTLGGNIDTTSYYGMLTSRVSPVLDVLASLRYEDRDDKTPQRLYLDSTANAVEYPNGVLNPRDSHKISRGKMEATYRLQDGYSLTGGLDFDRKATPDAYRDEVTDQTVRLDLRKSMGETLNGKITVAHSERTGKDWHLLELVSSGARFSTATGVAAPLQFADRQRDKAKVMVDWSPVDPLSLQFFYEYGKDKYPFTPPSGNAQMGMTDGETQLFGVDATYKVSDDWKLTGYYSFNQNKTHQNELYTPRLSGDNNCTSSTSVSGSVASSCIPWMADLNMMGEVLGLGVQGNLSGWKINANYFYSLDTTKYGITFNPAGVGNSVPVGAGVLPNTVYQLDRVNLSGVYAIRKDTRLRLDYIYDVRKVDDYTWSNWTFTDGTRVNVNPNQTTQLLGFTIIQTF